VISDNTCIIVTPVVMCKMDNTIWSLY